MSLNIDKMAAFTAGAVERFAQAQQQLVATGEAEGGKVRVTLAGDYVLREVIIQPEVIAKYRAEQIGQLIVAAHQRAREALEVKTAEMIQRFAREDGIDISSLVQ